ncbi:MAG TPA: hypothetical protein VLL76_11940, partial [Candidatus Omnitrophota bacterium]|nr:hypothetical protein [Candidatus Omnitrophota bacterium]
MRRLAATAARWGLAPRLILGGTVVAMLVWGGLDLIHSRRIETVVRAELTHQLQDDAHLDRLRFDASVRGHFAYVRMLASNQAVAAHAGLALARPAVTVSV